MSHVYVKFEGIRGESDDDKHKEWIDVATVKWSTSQQTTMKPGTGRRGSAAAPVCDSCELHVEHDAALAPLMEHCVEGKEIAKATVEIFAGVKAQHPLRRYTFEKVLIRDVSSTVDHDGTMDDKVLIDFAISKVESFDKSGKSTSYSRDWQSNKKL